MIDLQALFDGMSLNEQRHRAKTQMTLGAMIEKLKGMKPTARVANLVSAQSYRGYYIDLAFEQKKGTRPASELLSECLDAMGKVFGGYKGGDFVMGALTPVWVANYGCCGERLVDIGIGGKITMAPEDDGPRPANEVKEE
jgi:hypothetical protein